LSMNFMDSVRVWMMGLVVLMAFSGCAAIPRFTPENPYGVLEGAKEDEIFHVPTGIRVTRAQLLDMIGASRIIYIGETHDNVGAHRVQLEIITGLIERFPGQVAVGMEIFQRPYQDVMDRWSRVELSERDFLKQSQWYSNWGMDYGYYKAILDYIRKERIPLLALNASVELTKEMRNHGLYGLSETWQNQLPHMDFSDPHHRKLVEAFYKAHPPTSAKSFETFYQVYVLWDEVMAETVADYLATDEGGDKKLVVLAGGNHVRYGVGIPRRVFRRYPAAYTIVLPMEVSIPGDKKGRLMDVSLPEIPLAPADFFWMVTYEDLKGEKVRLGLIFEDLGGEPKVIKVLGESPAAKVGIQTGDILVSFDGEGLQESFDLSYHLSQKRPGDTGRLLIRRDDRHLEMTVRFETFQ
jgi:uncharacterized iron-regulated protein